MPPIRLPIVGLSKIARDQHVPAIAATPGIELVAIASRNASLDGIAHYATLEELLARAPEIDAVLSMLNAVETDRSDDPGMSAFRQGLNVGLWRN